MEEEEEEGEDASKKTPRVHLPISVKKHGNTKQSDDSIQVSSTLT
jgi:hypothetical protein